jgi:tRNA (cmo5U34)-methyltransferase
MRATVEQIRKRFDAAVDQFSNLQTGQSATVDAPFCLELVADAAAQITPNARQLLDVGCGAGNYTLKLIERLPNLDVTLLDLSRLMIDRAEQRVQAATAGRIVTIQGDVRDVHFAQASFDLILAGNVLHHLRGESEWKSVFHKFYHALRAGGSIWIVDLIEHANPFIQNIISERYRAYLNQLGGDELVQIVTTEIAEQDTPRPLLFQVNLLRNVGFDEVEILHKHLCYAAFGAIKSSNQHQQDRNDSGPSAMSAPAHWLRLAVPGQASPKNKSIIGTVASARRSVALARISDPAIEEKERE